MDEHDEDAVLSRCAQAAYEREGRSWDSAAPTVREIYRDEAYRALTALKHGNCLPGGLMVVKDEPVVLNLADILAATVLGPEYVNRHIEKREAAARRQSQTKP